MGVQSYPGATVYMGARVAHFAPELRQLRLVFLLTLPLGLVLIGGTSWAVAGGALGPVRRLADSLDRITARGLDARLEWPTSDREFLRLSAALNDMLQRLERSFHQATRFSADAAHELKTPLTVLQGELEAALRDPSVDAEAGALYTDLLEEVQRLKAIVEKLLLLSRADAGALRVSAQPFDLSSAAENLLEDMDIIAEELEVEGRITSGIQVMADPDLLTHVLGNLATNAMRYTPEGGWIRVEVDETRGKARLAVANGPVDIHADDRRRVFDRFVRLDPARTRRGEGSGLGLSLAREIARVHGGDLTLVEAPGQEATFLLELPLAPATEGGTPPAHGSEPPSSASP
ncbi:MAG: HAMP domain-containing protein [Armatimonadia bacterium]|nr:HAMP domain-containing protein [Armatimonadia bacterium]